MRFRLFLSLIAATVITTAALPALPSASQSRPQEIALQAAIRTETVDGNPRAAAEQFKAIIEDYPKDRAVVARALIHLADCYRKLGDAAARDVYARVVRDFGDQQDAVRQARARLDTGEGDVAPVRRLWTVPDAVDVAGRVSWNGRLLVHIDWSEAGAGDLFVRDLIGSVDRRLTKTGNRPDSAWQVFVNGAAVSRDGSQVAYEWQDRDRAELRILRLQGPSAPPRLVEWDTTLASVQPQDWTPDGRWLAAVWRRKNGTREIGLVSTTDGSLRPLIAVERACACNVTVAVSPDGRFLAFDMPGRETRARDIFVVPTAGGAATQVVDYAGDDALIGWAPDGASVVFKSARTGSAGLWSVSMDQGRPGCTSSLKLEIGAFSPLGISSTGAVYGCRCEPQAGSDIKVMSIDFATGRVLSTPVDAVQEFAGANTQPFWSSDGRFFVYRSLRQDQDPILAIRSAGTFALVKELRPRLASISDPRWSPDDKSIAVIGRDFNNRFGYFRIDVETGRASPIILYPSPGNRLNPMGPESSWSTDSRRVYFRRHPYTPPQGADLETLLVEVDVFTGEERVLARHSAPDTIPSALSPDGRTMYLRKPTGALPNEFAIVARNLVDGAERELFRRSGIGTLNISPDGRSLGLTVEPSATTPSTILLVPVGGGAAVELWRAEGPQAIGGPRLVAQGAGAWAVDSRSIIWRRMISAGRPELWWLSADGTGSRKLAELDGLNPAGLRIHPDGKRMLFAATVGASEQKAKPTEIWIWEHLLPAGARR